METLSGTIYSIVGNKGFGFIKNNDDDSTEIFFHCTDLVDYKFSNLRTGLQCEYFKKITPKGDAAIGVVIL